MQIDRPITIAIILFIILLVVFFFVVPEYKTFTKLQTELGIKKSEFNAEYDYYATVTKTYFDIQSRPEDFKKIDDALPADPNLGKIVYFLSDQALQNGLVIKDLFLSKSSLAVPGNKKSNINDIVFSMDLIGNYSSLTSFVSSLEKSSRLFEVTSIAFGSNSQNSPPSLSQFQLEQTFTFNIQIKTHSY